MEYCSMNISTISPLPTARQTKQKTKIMKLKRKLNGLKLRCISVDPLSNFVTQNCPNCDNFQSYRILHYLYYCSKAGNNTDLKFLFNVSSILILEINVDGKYHIYFHCEDGFSSSRLQIRYLGLFQVSNVRFNWGIKA